MKNRLTFSWSDKSVFLFTNNRQDTIHDQQIQSQSIILNMLYFFDWREQHGVKFVKEQRNLEYCYSIILGMRYKKLCLYKWKEFQIQQSQKNHIRASTYSRPSDF